MSSPGLTLSHEAKIDELIAQAMASETPPASAEAMTDYVIARDPSSANAWMKDKLTAHAKLRMRTKRQPKPNPLQQFLPGFEALPFQQRLTLKRKLPLKDGKEAELGDMSITQLTESITEIQATASAKALLKLEPMLDALQAIVNGMSPYAEAHSLPGNPLKVTAYFKRLEAGETPPPPRQRKSPEEASAIAKERAAKRTPAQRKAIAQKISETRKRRREEREAAARKRLKPKKPADE